MLKVHFVMMLDISEISNIPSKQNICICLWFACFRSFNNHKKIKQWAFSVLFVLRRFVSLGSSIAYEMDHTMLKEICSKLIFYDFYHLWNVKDLKQAKHMHMLMFCLLQILEISEMLKKKKRNKLAFPLLYLGDSCCVKSCLLWTSLMTILLEASIPD